MPFFKRYSQGNAFQHYLIILQTVEHAMKIFLKISIYFFRYIFWGGKASEGAGWIIGDTNGFGHGQYWHKSKFEIASILFKEIILFSHLISNKTKYFI